MNAVDMLESQHREVEDLFERLEKAEDGSDEKEDYFDQLADNLAIHAAIEEHQFYPAVKHRRTEDILLESLEEHLAVKRVLADLLDTDIGDPTFNAKIKLLKETVAHHVKEEESDLFPKVKKLFSEDELEALGEDMEGEQEQLLEEGEPRHLVPQETGHAASI
ncbi:MAG TPA: hemerythrin domain-containing protein [Polyangia bacterium]|nr:hemerythrin domain-containing protein [Polyangia bacterium]